jgi:hypothetical protein
LKKPTICGFTFVRNAILYDYPVTEAILSALPLCDHFVVAVGQSEDATLAMIRSIASEKIHIIETVWDDNLRSGGRVLAVETNKALDAISDHYDWCLYIQGDECLHEADYAAIRAGIEAARQDIRVEGLLFHYHHFYGSYDYLGASRRWYRREVRLIRNDKTIRSYRDAQGFRKWDKGTLRKLRVKLLPATVYHYGWVKHPTNQQRKQLTFNRLWHSDDWMSKNVADTVPYSYEDREPLVRFEGTHPQVMHKRIQAMNWQFSHSPALPSHSFKERLSKWIEDHTGWRIGEYRNYQLLD